MSEATTRTFSVYSNGMCHGLPILPPDSKSLRAMVVGASGQSGQPMVDTLSLNPQRWTNVYALSRRPPATRPGVTTVTHVPIDLTRGPGEISNALLQHQVQADFIFYFGYAQIPKSDEPGSEVFGEAEALAKINGDLFENFLTALDLASIHPRRIVLQTGGKNYGVHQGPVNVPLIEGAPRVHLEPNFYYTQEDILARYTKRHPGAEYNVVMPQWILGAVANTNMTIFYPLAVYASVQRKLKEPLRYPGDLTSWDNNHPISTALLLTRFYEWLVLTPDTAGESFNITDGSEFTFGNLWPILASWYGLEYLPPQQNASYSEVETNFTPRGYGPKGKLRSSFSFVEWAKEPKVVQAWAELIEEHGLCANPFQDPAETFSFLQFALELTWSWATSMDKARRYGWHGYCDSVQAIRVTFEKYGDMKMVPPLQI